MFKLCYSMDVTTLQTMCYVNEVLDQSSFLIYCNHNCLVLLNRIPFQTNTNLAHSEMKAFMNTFFCSDTQQHNNILNNILLQFNLFIKCYMLNFEFQHFAIYLKHLLYHTK